MISEVKSDFTEVFVPGVQTQHICRMDLIGSYAALRRACCLLLAGLVLHVEDCTRQSVQGCCLPFCRNRSAHCYSCYADSVERGRPKLDRHLSLA